MEQSHDEGETATEVAELIDRLDGELGTTTRLRPMPMVAAPPRPRPASLPIPSRALQPEPFRLSYAVPLSPPYAPREGAASPDFQRPVEEMAGPPLSAVVAARFATRQVEVAEEQAVWQVGPIDQPLVTPSPSGGRGGIPPEPDAFLEMTYDAPAARREVPKSALPPEPPPPEEVFRFDFDLSEAEGTSAPPPLPNEPLVAAAKSEAAAEAEAERDTLPGVPIPPRPAEVDRPPNVEASWASFDAGATVAIGPPAAGREEIVTETLAELYVAQGLIPEARDAYFALARVDVDPQRAARLREKAERLAAPLPPPARDPRAARLREWAARVERKEPGGDLQGVVAALVASGNGIDFAIVTETEGVPVVTSGPFGAVEEGLAAELADFWKTLQRGRDDVGAGDAKLVSLAARDGGIVIAPVGHAYALIVRSSASAPPGLVRWETARAASRLRPLLA